MIRRSHLFIALLLIIIGVILRLWRLPELFHFTYDEEVFAFVGKRMWVNHHIPLIGGVTPMHVHVAPYFYWFSGILLGMFKLNPLGWGIMSAVIAALTMLVLFLSGKKLFNTRVAILALVLYAFSFSQNIFDRHYWGLSFNGLWSLLSLLSLHQLLAGKKQYALVLAGVFFFSFHADLSTLVLYVLTGLVLILVYLLPRVTQVKKDIQILFAKSVGIAFLAFLFSLLPLLVFDIRHQFANSKGIFQYLREVNELQEKRAVNSFSESLLFLPQVLARSLHIFGNTDMALQYSYCEDFAAGKLRAVPPFISIIMLVFVFYALYVTHKQHGTTTFLLLISLFVSVYLGIFIYSVIAKGDLFDHYVTTLLPPFYLLVGVVIDRLKKRKLLVIVIISALISANLFQLKNASHRYGYQDKMAAVEYALQQTKGEDFSLDVLGDCFRYNGYRYLFYVAGKEPSKSYVDTNFTHLYDRTPSFNHPKKLVIFTNPSISESEDFYNEYNKYLNKLITSSTFGYIEVLIVDNSQLDFVGKF